MGHCISETRQKVDKKEKQLGETQKSTKII